MENTNKKKKKKKNDDQNKNKTPKQEQSLLCFLQSLNSMLVVIELRNDCVIRGTVEECDDTMSVTLINCEKVTIDGDHEKHERMFVKNRMIRAVHVPARFDCCDLIERKRKEVFEAKRFYRQQMISGRNVGTERLGKGADNERERLLKEDDYNDNNNE